MKWFFWFLLLVNLLLLAFMQWGKILTDENKNAQSLPPLHADKIKLLTATTSAVAAASALPSAPHTLATVQSASTVTCLEWSEFSGGDLTRAQAALDSLNLGDRLSQRQIEYAIGYWAYIPAPQTRKEVDGEIAILKKRGVEDYFIVQETGKWHNAISLGVFKTEGAAHKFLQIIRAKGIKTAVVAERPSKFKFTVFRLKNLDLDQVDKVTALQKVFSDSELKPAACD